MKPTDVRDPSYFHRVVDCQWACPAHTNVPEYIRLIAQGRYTDAYMVNRESNVFPAILGRTCDRPCEPACRRVRVDGTPVAICRLQRVAADLRGEIAHLLPTIPDEKNGKRIACIGAGPASLTVANDLLPLGYEVVIFEKHEKPGGLMRTNIPAFRLPESVLMDEIGIILDMGAQIRYNTPITSLKALLAQGFDALFVGSGAPRGKDLDLPGRHDTDRIHIGIDWLEAIAFGHTASIVDEVPMQSTLPSVFFGGDAAWGPKNIIWAVEHGHQAAISIHNHCQGSAVTERPPQGMNLSSQKMGLTEWSYHNDYNPAPRQKMSHVELTERF